MNLRTAILEENSRQQVDKIVQWVGNDPLRTKQLMDIFLRDEYRIVQRAAWIVSAVAASVPDLMRPHIPSLVKRLQDKDTHIAVKRNVYRVMQYLELPEEIHSDLMNSCFDSLADVKEALAVRAFAMSILARFALLYPEIGHELRLILEDALRQESAASFKSRAKKVLKQIGTQQG